MKTEPYFMKNEKWYYFDENSFSYKLTKDAPKKAIDSYNEYYSDRTKSENGEPVIVT
nr:MAG TPA: Putative cell wall binding repeat [Caudoviricetes sp.]